MKGNGFFSVGLDEIHGVFELGLNEACLYLVYAAGTGGKNAETSWSIQALIRYTGVTRRRGEQAQQGLLKNGFTTRLKDGKHPRFKLTRSDESELVWLPNSFVTGVSDETPPLARIRQTGDVLLLRLIIDLYSVANIADEGGVPKDVVFLDYERERIADYAEFIVYGYRARQQSCYTTHPVVSPHTSDTQSKSPGADFFSRVRTLQELGLVYFVPTLFESNNGEVMFPLIDPFTRETIPAITGVVGELLPDIYDGINSTHDFVILLPRHFKEAVLNGIVVLHYRQNTSITTAGYAATKERIEQWSKLYKSMQCAISREYQGGIKGVSKESQGVFQGGINDRRN